MGVRFSAPSPQNEKGMTEDTICDEKKFKNEVAWINLHECDWHTAVDAALAELGNGHLLIVIDDDGQDKKCDGSCKALAHSLSDLFGIEWIAGTSAKELQAVFESFHMKLQLLNLMGLLFSGGQEVSQLIMGSHKKVTLDTKLMNLVKVGGKAQSSVAQDSFNSFVDYITLALMSSVGKKYRSVVMQQITILDFKEQRVFFYRFLARSVDLVSHASSSQTFTCSLSRDDSFLGFFLSSGHTAVELLRDDGPTHSQQALMYASKLYAEAQESCRKLDSKDESKKISLKKWSIMEEVERKIRNIGMHIRNGDFGDHICSPTNSQHDRDETSDSDQRSSHLRFVEYS